MVHRIYKKNLAPAYRIGEKKHLYQAIFRLPHQSTNLSQSCPYLKNYLELKLSFCTAIISFLKIQLHPGPGRLTLTYLTSVFLKSLLNDFLHLQFRLCKSLTHLSQARQLPPTAKLVCVKNSSAASPFL